ncbi:hypothetical protein CEXT_312841 [Caerostris extrusa]|uniref:Uncharacterized protein n=1 Tax=Caerostris extrusa TaxID=172846 RepID=A0AAV4S8W9_CAEEX|nr:hypothetical protein CEXT_312841 [Caerostris extrusa]
MVFPTVFLSCGFPSKPEWITIVPSVERMIFWLSPKRVLQFWFLESELNPNSKIHDNFNRTIKEAAELKDFRPHIHFDKLH